MSIFKPLSYAKQQSTYAGLPVKALDDTMNTLQDRYDTNAAEMDALEIMAANLDVAEGDQGIKDEAIATLSGEIENIVNRGDYENAQPLIRNASKKLATNDQLINAIKNKEQINKDRELLRELKAKGLNTLVFNDPNTWSSIGEDGKNRVYTSDIQPQLDYDKRIEDIWKIISPDAIQQNIISEDEYNLIRTGRVQEISPDKISKLVDYAYDRYMTTPEGQQELRKINELDGTFSSRANPEDWAKATIKDRVMDTGLMKVFKVDDYRYVNNVNKLQKQADAQKRAEKREELKAVQASIGITNGPTITNPAGVPQTTVEFDTKYDTQQQLVESYQKDYDEAYTTYSDENATTAEKQEARQNMEKYKGVLALEKEKERRLREIRETNYYNWLRDPVDENGNPIDFYEAEDMMLNDKEFNILMQGGNYVYNTLGLEKQAHKRFEGEIGIDPLTKMTDDILAYDIGKSDNFNLEEVSLVDAVSSTGGMSSDAVVRQRAEQEEKDRVLLGQKLDASGNPTAQNVYVPSIVADKFVGIKLTPENVDKIAATLDDYRPVVSAIEKVNNIENSDRYFQTVSQHEHQPKVIDFSRDMDGNKSDVSNTLTGWVNNHQQAYTYIYEGQPFTYDEFAKQIVGDNPVGDFDFDIVGSTTYVPQQGYLLKSNFSHTFRGKEKDQVGVTGEVYVVPTELGLEQSGMSDRIFNELIQDYYKEKGKTAVGKYGNVIEYAHSIVDDQVERQLDVFYYNKPKPGIDVSAKYYLKGNADGNPQELIITRKTNDRGVPTFRITDPVTGTTTKEVGSLMSLQNVLQATEREETYIPVTNDTFVNLRLDDKIIDETYVDGFKFRLDFANKLYAVDQMLPSGTTMTSLTRTMGNPAYSGGNHSKSNAVDIRLTPEVRKVLEANSMDDPNAAGWRIMKQSVNGREVNMGLRYLIHGNKGGSGLHVHLENYN